MGSESIRTIQSLWTYCAQYFTLLKNCPSKIHAAPTLQGHEHIGKIPKNYHSNLKFGDTLS